MNFKINKVLTLAVASVFLGASSLVLANDKVEVKRFKKVDNSGQYYALAITPLIDELTFYGVTINRGNCEVESFKEYAKVQLEVTSNMYKMAGQDPKFVDPRGKTFFFGETIELPMYCLPREVIIDTDQGDIGVTFTQ